MDEKSPATLTASEASRRMADGLLSSVDLVQACLDRIHEVEPAVQAWQYLDEAHALKQAQAADDRRRSGIGVGALNGLPVGIKDIIDTEDMPTENGTVLHHGRMPRTDAKVVASLRVAGAVILGKTVTTECAYFSPGKTRNPWNPEHTPGGSSSGSAAAVAALMTPLALGSQTNGSVIRPASFCGVYGFKPTHGLIPRTGILKLSRLLDHVGIFSRSLDDLALVAEELAGYDEGDPDSLPRGRVAFLDVLHEEPPIPPMLAFLRTPHWDRMAPDARDAFDELREVLGDRIEELELLPSASEAWSWQKTIMEADMASNFEREWLQGRDKLSPQLRGLIERGREVKVVDYQRAVLGAQRAGESFDEIFMERYDAIVTPAALGGAPKGLDSTGDPAFCTPWSLLGFPTVSLPLMQGADGMPIGVQLVGRRNFDARLLRTARWLSSRAQA